MRIEFEDEDQDAFVAALGFVDAIMSTTADEEELVALDELPELQLIEMNPSVDWLAGSVNGKRKHDKREEKGKRQCFTKAKKSQSSSKNRARDQERQEVLYLREKMAELERKLQALRKTWDSASAVARDTQDDGETQDEVASEVWKKMAVGQLEQRLKSERENKHLKLVLARQLKIARSLEKLLEARSTTNVIENCLRDGQRLKRIHRHGPDWSDATGCIFEQLKAGIDSAYGEVDTIFHDNGLDTRESSFSDAEIHEGANGVYMKVFASKVLPFDVRSTSGAAWRYFSSSLDHTPVQFWYHKDLQTWETTDDTIFESFGMELHAKGTQADYRVKQIVRRYVEEDRVVIVWRSYIDPVSFAGNPVSGAEFQEKGYLVVRRPRAMSPRFALLQTCYLISPALPIRSLSDERSVTGELTDFVLSGTEANVAAAHQTIENILFDEASTTVRV